VNSIFGSEMVPTHRFNFLLPMNANGAILDMCMDGNNCMVMCCVDEHLYGL
jgi:hypothetical protein